MVQSVEVSMYGKHAFNLRGHNFFSLPFWNEINHN